MQAFAPPVASAQPDVRNAYLRKVATLTFVGLLASGVVGLFSAMLVDYIPMLSNRWVSLGVILGGFAIANYVAPRMVYGRQKALGFAVGIVGQGIAMGYVLLTAIVVSMGQFGSPYILVGQAMGITGLAALGMLAYTWTKPRKFSLLKAGLSMLTLPMLALMAISFIFPIGGVWGLLLTGVFVVVSAAALLYQINNVLHRMTPDMHIEGAYQITLGLLMLFWNVLVLVTSLSRR